MRFVANHFAPCFYHLLAKFLNFAGPLGMSRILIFPRVRYAQSAAAIVALETAILPDETLLPLHPYAVAAADEAVAESTREIAQAQADYHYTEANADAERDARIVSAEYAYDQNLASLEFGLEAWLTGELLAVQRDRGYAQLLDDWSHTATSHQPTYPAAPSFDLGNYFADGAYEGPDPHWSGPGNWTPMAQEVPGQNPGNASGGATISTTETSPATLVPPASSVTDPLLTVNRLRIAAAVQEARENPSAEGPPTQAELQQDQEILHYLQDAYNNGNGLFPVHLIALLNPQTVSELEEWLANQNSQESTSVRQEYVAWERKQRAEFRSNLADDYDANGLPDVADKIRRGGYNQQQLIYLNTDIQNWRALRPHVKFVEYMGPVAAAAAVRGGNPVLTRPVPQNSAVPNENFPKPANSQQGNFRDKVSKANGNVSRSTNVFPADPNDFTKQIGVQPSKITTTKDGTIRMVWEPNENTRIRFESHPDGLKPGDPGFNPRHHGEHYHIMIKPDGMSWGQAERRGLIMKGRPAGYIQGSGTGFLPDEPFPGRHL